MRSKTLLLLSSSALVLAAMACSSSGSSSPSPSPSPSPSGSSSTSQAPSAYDRLGGHAGILAFVKGEVENKILADSDLKTYFFSQVATPIPAGHPSGAQIEECFTRLVANVLGAEAYPGTAVADASNTNTPNFTCRDMTASHVGLKIGDKTFDKFVSILAADLQPLVVPDGAALTKGHISQSELNALGAALNGQKKAIVDPTAAPGPAPFPG